MSFIQIWTLSGYEAVSDWSAVTASVKSSNMCIFPRFYLYELPESIWPNRAAMVLAAIRQIIEKNVVFDDTGSLLGDLKGLLVSTLGIWKGLMEADHN